MLREQVELRRDFHALGFAYMIVRELDRCYGGDKVDLKAFSQLALRAARDLVVGHDPAALLREAFESLEQENRKLQLTPAVFTDTLHGGELFSDIGFFEIDWPEHPADTLRTYLQWAKNRSYQFNIDLGATTVRELAMRFPDLFAQLTSDESKRCVEFVNGSCNQPYPPFHSLESQIRQFDIGRKIWRDVLGTSLKTYASQEFGFCPQLASVLKMQGYDNAVIRVQNMGDAPTVKQEQINWQAPNGDTLRSLPSHPHKSENMNEFTYNNLHLKLYLHQQEGLDFAVFTCLGDITYHRPMREEMARVCHYAPVFGRFETFQNYFLRTQHLSVEDTQFYMRDFHCDAAFINLDRWSMYKNYSGNYNSNCMSSMTSTNLFAAAEMIDAIAATRGVSDYQEDDHEKNWEALTHQQGHGTYIVPYYQSGGFLGPGDSPSNHAVGRGAQNVTEYNGPTDFRQVKQVTDDLMARSKTRARKIIGDRLTVLSSQPHGDHGFCLYNFAPAREQIVRLPGASGKTFELDDRPLPAQDHGDDRLIRMTLPAYGFVTICESEQHAPQPTEAVTVGDDFIENAILRAEFDLQNGTIRRLVYKSEGQNILRANSCAYYFPGSLPQVCRKSTIRHHGPLRVCIEFDVELQDKRGGSSQLRTCFSLDADQDSLSIDTQVIHAPQVEGNQWENHLGLRYELTEPSIEILTSHFNVLEAFPHRQIFSPNVLLAQGRPVR